MSTFVKLSSSNLNLIEIIFLRSKLKNKFNKTANSKKIKRHRRVIAIFTSLKELRKALIIIRPGIIHLMYIYLLL